MSGRADRVPRVPRVAWLLLDPDYRDVVRGDLEEIFWTALRPHHGPVRARILYWRQVAGTLITGVARREAARSRRRRSRRTWAKPRALETLLPDLRYAARNLIKSPGNTAVAVVTMGLGIGLTTHAFGMIYGAVWRGLPVPEPDELVHLSETRPGGAVMSSVPVDHYLDWRARQDVFTNLAAFYRGTVNVVDSAHGPERFAGAFMTANSFAVLGVQARLGRTLLPADADPTASASRKRVAGQVLMESVLIAAVGGVLGLVFSAAGTVLLDRVIAGIEKPFWIALRMDPAVFLFAAMTTGLACLFAGVLPAVKASGIDVGVVLRDYTGVVAGRWIARFCGALVIVELAVSFGVLLTAGLMIESVWNVRSLNWGFSPEAIVTARVGLFESEYPDPASRRVFFDRLATALRSVPGIETASLTTVLPGTESSRWAVEVEGDARDLRRWVHRASVTPGFFATLGVRVQVGRDFAVDDRAGAKPVVIVSQSFAERHLAPGPALGRRLRLVEPGRWMTVVGIAPDLRGGAGVGGIGLDRASPEAIYTPLAQVDRRFVSLAVRTGLEPSAAIPRLRETVAALDGNLPIYSAMSMREVRAASTWAFDIFGALFFVFGLTALGLAAVGLYGVMTVTVHRRVRELGVRRALGAGAAGIATLVLRRVLGQFVVGIVVGSVLAGLLSRPLRLVLFEVAVTDVQVYALIAGTLMVSSLVACWVPMRRAARVDPMDVIRAG